MEQPKKPWLHANATCIVMNKSDKIRCMPGYKKYYLPASYNFIKFVHIFSFQLIN